MNHINVIKEATELLQEARPNAAIKVSAYVELHESEFRVELIQHGEEKRGASCRFSHDDIALDRGVTDWIHSLAWQLGKR